MSIKNQHQIRLEATVDLKSVAQTTIYTAAGKSFIPTRVYVYKSARSGSGTTATVSIGNNASTYSNIMNGAIAGAWFTALGIAQGECTFDGVVCAPDTGRTVIDLDTGIRINVTVASTYTTDTAIIILEGIQIDV
jgi:hypothetical protein